MLAPVQFLVTILKSVSVEPALFLLGLSLYTCQISGDLGIYRVMCDKLFNSNGGTELNNHSAFDCWDTSRSLSAGVSTNESQWWLAAEDLLQQETTAYSMILSLTTIFPMMIANIILGAYADRNGRKGVLLSATAGLILFTVPFLIIFAAPKIIPIYIIYIIAPIASLTGSFGAVIASATAYLSDTVENPNTLSIRIAVLQMCLLVGVTVAPLVSNAVSAAYGYAWAFVVATATSTLALLCIYTLVKWVKPRNAQTKIESSKSIPKIAPIDIDSLALAKISGGDKENNSSTEQHPGFIQEIKEVVLGAPSLLAEAWRTISKPRQGYKRAYLLAAMYTTFVSHVIDFTLMGTVFTLYVQKEPFSWTQDRVSSFRSLANLIRLGGTAIGILTFKKCLKTSNTLILFTAILSLTAQTALIALATVSSMLYVATVAGALGSLVAPVTQAFVALIVDPDEVGKAYGALTLAVTLASLFGTETFGAVYTATVAAFPSLTFVICAVLMCTALILSTWLHFVYNRGVIKSFLNRACVCGRVE